jgi:hypothetical protein
MAERLFVEDWLKSCLFAAGLTSRQFGTTYFLAFSHDYCVSQGDFCKKATKLRDFGMG